MDKVIEKINAMIVDCKNEITPLRSLVKMNTDDHQKAKHRALYGVYLRFKEDLEELLDVAQNEEEDENLLRRQQEVDDQMLSEDY
ncbi:MAG: hypothetical protein AAFO07_33625 [Bacteroidota bacterium]